MSKLYSVWKTLGSANRRLHRLFQGKVFIVQFLENYSDRRMEQALSENVAVKWFCQYALKDSVDIFMKNRELRS